MLVECPLLVALGQEGVVGHPAVVPQLTEVEPEHLGRGHVQRLLAVVGLEVGTWDVVVHGIRVHDVDLDVGRASVRVLSQERVDGIDFDLHVNVIRVVAYLQTRYAMHYRI